MTRLRTRRQGSKVHAHFTGIKNAQRELAALRSSFEHWKALARKPLTKVADEIEAGNGGETRAEIVAYIRKAAESLEPGT